MKNITKKIYFSRDMMVFIIIFAAFTANVHAASFDCAKAGTDVEKTICANTELSELDTKMGETYTKALKLAPDPQLLKQQQRDWLKVRNQCTMVSCLKAIYQVQITGLRSVIAKSANSDNQNKDEKYVLMMSADDAVCNHVHDIYNEDAKKYGRFNEDKHEEFTSIGWKPFSYYINRGPSEDLIKHQEEIAVFDINNDGKLENVLRVETRIRGIPYNRLMVFGHEKSVQENMTISAVEYMHLNSVNVRTDKEYRINWSKISDPVYKGKYEYNSSLGLSWIKPFIYNNTSYLAIEVIRGIKPSLLLIAKYRDKQIIAKSGRKLADNDDWKATSDLEHICYLDHKLDDL